MSALLNPKKNFDRFIEKKEPQDYTDEVVKEIQLLRASHNGEIIPFGSSTYKIQKYPSDVDILELYDIHQNKENVVTNFDKVLRKIVSEIKSKPDHYYSEIKAGLDKRYMFPIGIMRSGTFQMDKLFIHKLSALLTSKLIDVGNYNLIYIALNKFHRSANAYDVIKYVLREYYILRWTADEIMRGSKKLKGGVTKKLTEAVSDDTLLKIDEITIIEDKYTEITNTYYLFYEENGEKIPINRSNNVYESLPIDIERLLYSDMFFNPFKAVKRLFALARAPLNVVKPEFKNLLEKLFDFISSSTSMLYQMKSELENILLLIEKYGIENEPRVNKNINHLKSQLTSALEIKRDKLNQMDAQIDLIVKQTDKKAKYALIKELKKEIQRHINYQTICFFNMKGLNPMPQFVLPPVATYSWKTLDPYIEPVNPLYRL